MLPSEKVEQAAPASVQHPDASAALFNDSQHHIGQALRGAGDAIGGTSQAYNELQYGIQAKESQIGLAGLRGIGHAFASLGREFSKENPEVGPAIRSAGGAFMHAGNEQLAKQAAFEKSRPLMSAIEAPVPGLQAFHAMMVGGLDQHKQPPQQARTEVVHPVANPTHPEVVAHPAQPAHPATAQQPAERHTGTAQEHLTTLHLTHGESYWTAANEALGGHASNKDIAAKMTDLERLNGNKKLYFNDTLKLV